MRALLVARYMDEHDGALLRGTGERAGKIGDAESVETVRQRSKRERAALGKLGNSAFEVGHVVNGSIENCSLSPLAGTGRQFQSSVL